MNNVIYEQMCEQRNNNLSLYKISICSLAMCLLLSPFMARFSKFDVLETLLDKVLIDWTLFNYMLVIVLIALFLLLLSSLII